MKRIVKKPDTPQTAIDQYWNRRFNITSFLFDKQLAFVEDPSNYKIAVCSRRAGKTVSCAAHLTDVAIKNKDVICLYITLSAANAKKLIWKELKNLNTKFNLLGVPNESELSITYPNGSTIYASGAKDKAEIEKFRGLPIKLCYIDECQSFRDYIEDLIDDIIEPTLLDYDGTLCLIGTPGSIPAGYFHECAEVSDVWSKHKWTFFDNPHIASKSNKTHQELLARVLKRRNLTVDHPSIQREYFGKWEFDSESLIVQYDKTINNWDGILNPRFSWNYILGIDVGFNDSDALGVLAWSEQDPVTYLVKEVITAKQGLTPLVKQIRDLEKEYSISKMTMDMGGLGKKLGEEMIRQYQLPVEAADKTRKMENIELLNDALRRGHFKAKSTSRFTQDSYLVEKDLDKSKPDRIVVSDRYHSDIIDSVLYAFKFSPAFAYEPPPDKPPVGSREWAEQQQSAMFEAAQEHFQKESEDYRRMNGEFD